MKKFILILAFCAFLLNSCGEEKTTSTEEYKQIEQNITSNEQDKVFDTATISDDKNYEATESKPISASGSENLENIFGSGENSGN